MKMSESIAKLGAALASAQGEMKAVAKDSTNPHFRNSYASLDTILENVRPTLAKHGLSLLQGASTPHTDEAGRVTAFSVETMLLHASGEYIINTAIMPLAKHDPQGAGGALTYGRRYSVSALLALATEEDDDGQAASPRPMQKAAPAKPRAARPAPVMDDDTPPLPPELQDVFGDAEPMDHEDDVPACRVCGGAMWDNRRDKRNPKAPDFKCRDKQCDGAIWLQPRRAA